MSLMNCVIECVLASRMQIQKLRWLATILHKIPNPSLTFSWEILLFDSLFYSCKERLWVKPRPEWQWCPQGPFYPLYLSVPGFLHCLENTAAAAAAQQARTVSNIYIFLAGPAHWVQSSWDISNIGLTWYISFVSHTKQIWKQKSFDWYKNTIKDILHLLFNKVNKEK